MERAGLKNSPGCLNGLAGAYEWGDILRDLDRLQKITLEQDGKRSKSGVQVELKQLRKLPVGLYSWTLEKCNPAPKLMG